MSHEERGCSGQEKEVKGQEYTEREMDRHMKDK